MIIILILSVKINIIILLVRIIILILLVKITITILILLKRGYIYLIIQPRAPSRLLCYNFTSDAGQSIYYYYLVVFSTILFPTCDRQLVPYE